MAVAARYTKVWVDEFDFSGDSFSAVMALTSPVVDVTTFQQSAKVWQVIWPEASLAQAGYVMTFGDTELEKALHDRLGSAGAHHVAALYGTNLGGCPAYVLPGTSARNMQMQTPVDGVLTLNSEWVSGTGIKRGLRVADEEADATGALAGVDFGAAGAAGGYAYLFVRAIDGMAEDAVLAVESAGDPGFGTPAVEGTFTVNAVGSQALALSGGIGRYIRVNVTDLGGADAIEFGAVVCVAGVTM